METRGNVLTRGLWESQTDAMIYVRLGDLDCETHNEEPMETLLDRWVKYMEENHGKYYNNQQKRFLHFLSLLMV